MGLLTELFANAVDDEYRLAQDLVAIAIADGSISKEEYNMMVKICRSMGISTDVIDAYISGGVQTVPEDVPMSDVDKADYLSKLIQVMAIDGRSTQMEIFLLEIIAGKMGVGRMQLLSLVLTATSRRHIPGDKGSKALHSFTRNIIDPKSKTLAENLENLRTVVFMMAEHVHRCLPQADADEFSREMEAAIALLAENDVLNKEFSSMGLDFKQTLQIECNHAVASTS